MLALLNAPVLTSYGSFTYQPVSVEAAKHLLQAGFASYIGHQSTCDIMGMLLGIEVPLNRANYVQQSGEMAIVFKLKTRVPEGVVLQTAGDIQRHGYEFGLLTKL